MENNNNKIPGKGAATASMVLGIIAVALWFFGYSALVSVILGIVGLILSGNANGGLRAVPHRSHRRRHLLCGLHCLRWCHRLCGCLRRF